MYLNQTKRLVTLNELSEVLAVPRNSLIKVSNQLAKLGHIETSRGRNGGLQINRDAGKLTLKSIILQTEESFNIAECFNDANCKCYFMNLCPLKGRLKGALNMFLDALGDTSLDEVTPIENGR
tara:strand:- start:11 stop:379 length:369 start_codon:yes stop_codon:yes gene_type:complete